MPERRAGRPAVGDEPIVAAWTLRRTVAAAAVALLAAAASAPGSDAGAARPRVELTTPLGAIVVELEPERAPETAANFLRYVDEERLRGASFYRVVRDDNQPDAPVRIDVVQGGLGFEESGLRLPPIAHETTATSGLRHLDGTLSMARAEPGSASSEIFVCVGDQPELDFGGRRNPDGQGFAAFGRVVEGMEVVRAIHRRPAEGQFLREPVPITAVRRLP
jgi:peptidyl-prolyl cis-trans isomerase A (cyclophilin A)